MAKHFGRLCLLALLALLAVAWYTTASGWDDNATPAEASRRIGAAVGIGGDGFDQACRVAMAKMIVTRITRAIQILPKLVSLRTDQTAAPSNLPAILIVTHVNQTTALSNAANVVNHGVTRRIYGAAVNFA